MIRTSVLKESTQNKYLAVSAGQYFYFIPPEITKKPFRDYKMERLVKMSEY